MSDCNRLIYVHDPMCSWCWGFRPSFELLCKQLPAGLSVNRLLGGLAPDNDQPMPAELQSKLQDTWRRIQTRIPGTRFNFDFWSDCHPRRSTWPACRAVIAARQSEPSLESPMIEAIQRAYYLEARNPSDTDTLAALAGQLGLDPVDFARRLDAAETHHILEQEITQARRMGADSFPSLRLQVDQSFWPVPVDYTEVTPMLETIQSLLES
ncbi:MAG: DsbA family protein [Gammaproteobacteria bacterium]|nr:DsbA family protein [Gammaproteobacteria bacterium]